MTVIYEKDKKLKPFNGENFEDWESTSRRELKRLGKSGKDALRMLEEALVGPAEQEFAVQNDLKTPDELFSCFRQVFGDQRTPSQKFASFYARTQNQNESIMDYSHALVKLLDQVTLKDETERDAILINQFKDNINDGALKWELAKQENANLNFLGVRNVALSWVSKTKSPSVSITSDSKPPTRQKASVEALSCTEERLQNLERKLASQDNMNNALLAKLEEIKGCLEPGRFPVYDYGGGPYGRGRGWTREGESGQYGRGRGGDRGRDRARGAGIGRGAAVGRGAPNAQGDENPPSAEDGCWECGQLDHIKRFCPSRRGRGRGRGQDQGNY